MFCFNHFFELLVLLVPLVPGFTHPGLLVTNNDINRIKKTLDVKKDPWLVSWSKLTSMESTSASYTNNAVSTVDRTTQGSTPSNADRKKRQRLLFRFDGRFPATPRMPTPRDKLHSIGANDEQYLVAGLQGHELANAGELLRDYPPFVSGGGQAKFFNMMTSLFLEKNLFFLNHHAGSEHIVNHFFANWEFANLASAMAISVLTDNQTVWEYSIEYFKNGVGNGAINNAVTNIVLEPGTGNPLGQDKSQVVIKIPSYWALLDSRHGIKQKISCLQQQSHSSWIRLISLATLISLSAVYFARYNLGNDVPFERYTNGLVSFSQISSASRGAVRPAWDLLYNHYIVTKNQKAPILEGMNQERALLGKEAGIMTRWAGAPRCTGWTGSDVTRTANIAVTSASLIPSSALPVASSAISSSSVLTIITPTHTPSGHRHHHHSHYSSSTSTSTPVPPQNVCYAPA
ncbi:hypothetical protein DPV78_000255 [Talaromyces pinophilus]|nr:hypothetical protein DPV78_000255 [Talaromyces pinophilus]